jgi:hypothetical protein
MRQIVDGVKYLTHLNSDLRLLSSTFSIDPDTTSAKTGREGRW